MGKGTITILFVISLFIISMSLISAAETKLLCLDNGESVEFSKCNSLIPDRTCQNDRGCQYCVSEISSGVYCPRNINECNSLGFTCEDNSNSNLIPEDNKITSNPKPNTNTNTPSTNTNTNINTNTNTSSTNTNTNKNTTTKTNNQNKSNQSSVNVNKNNDEEEVIDEDVPENTENIGNIWFKIKTLFTTPIDKGSYIGAIVINKNIIQNNESSNEIPSDSKDTITIKKTTFYGILLFIPLLIEIAMLIGLLILDNHKRKGNKNSKENNTSKNNKKSPRNVKKTISSKISEIKDSIK